MTILLHDTVRGMWLLTGLLILAGSVALAMHYGPVHAVCAVVVVSCVWHTSSRVYQPLLTVSVAAGAMAGMLCALFL